MSKGIKVGIALLVLVWVAGLAMIAWWGPGGPGNPHEWLNDTMKREFKPQKQSAVSLGKWTTDKWNYSSYVSEITIGNISAVSVSKANYSMFEVTTPDDRCFSADICLKHGEMKMRPCVKK